MTRGRKPKSPLQVVREGNPGHRPLRDPVRLPPSALAEPEWSHLLPGKAASDQRARSTAAELWRRTAPTLARSVGLVGEQQEALVDYCLTWARIEQGERSLSRDGVVIASPRSDRGTVRNPWTTVLHQYRSHFRALAAELGLTPSALSRLTRSDLPDEDDPFDA